MANSEKKSDRSMLGLTRNYLEEWLEAFEVELSEVTNSCGRSRVVNSQALFQLKRGVLVSTCV